MTPSITFKGKPITASAVLLLNTIFVRAEKDLDVTRFNAACLDLGIVVKGTKEA